MAEPTDYAVKIEWLKGELQREQVALQRLEAKRETAYLDGIDVPKLLRDLSNKQEQISTIEKNVATAERRVAEARSAAGWATLEGDAALIKETAVPALERSWREMHDLMVALDAKAAEIAAHEQAIQTSNIAVQMGDYVQGDYRDDRDEAMYVAAGFPRLTARKPSRADLLIDADAIRARVSDELAAGPELPGVIPFKGESQTAFNLRTVNRADRLASMARESDPLKLAAVAARTAIETTVLAGSPFENAERRVREERFRIKGGGPGETQAVDGMRPIDGLRRHRTRIGIDRPALSTESAA